MRCILFHVKHGGRGPIVASQHCAFACDNRAPFGASPAISLARYAALLESRQFRQTIVVSLLGRLPIGICGLAIPLLVQFATGSFAVAGARSCLPPPCPPPPPPRPSLSS